MTAEPDAASPTPRGGVSSTPTPEAAAALVNALRDVLARLRSPVRPTSDDESGRADAESETLTDVPATTARWDDYIHSDDSGESTPFVSVVLLVGAASYDQVNDALVALDAQTDTDFELLVVAPDVEPVSSTQTPAPGTRLEELLGAFSSGLAPRSRVVTARDSATRDECVSLGLASARGRYVTFLDATSVVFGHFVATFGDLATASPAAVVRARAIAQPLRVVTWPDGDRGYEPTSGARIASAPRFSPLEHLVGADSQDFLGSPPGSYAIRRRDAELLGLEAGENELLVEAAVLGGVSDHTDEVVVLLHRFDEGKFRRS